MTNKIFRGYCSRGVDSLSASHLTKSIRSLKLPEDITQVVDADKLHCTVMYDPGVEGPETDLPFIPGLTNSVFATPSKYEVFDLIQGDPKARISIVLTLDSPALCSRFDRLIDCGFKYTYPTYRPRVSVAYITGEITPALREYIEVELAELSRVTCNTVPSIVLLHENWEPLEQ